LLLNAAFLGGLSDEDRRILGFGDKTHYIPNFQRRPRHAGFQGAMRLGYGAKLRAGGLIERVRARLSRGLAPARKRAVTNGHREPS
jgi:hypothetical protein